MELAFTQEATPRVPADADNLAVRAARLLMGLVGVGTSPDATATADVPITRLHLTKRIPVAAGMAGGSADAAAALVALNHLWGTDLDRDELRDLAAELGADVPFCVTGGTALATGTGTATAQVLTRGDYHWVVGISDQPLSTRRSTAPSTRSGRPSEVEPDAVLQALRTGDAEALGAALHNDLEVAAFHLRPSYATRRDARGRRARVPSSAAPDPTVVGWPRRAQDALELAGRVRDPFDRVEVAVSPAGGPELAAG
jgi:4-diphosphocytidyl-2-C-methyl-D-erythritol kinase